MPEIGTSASDLTYQDHLETLANKPTAGAYETTRRRQAVMTSARSELAVWQRCFSVFSDNDAATALNRKPGSWSGAHRRAPIILSAAA
jgi:hypothetical protein